MTRIIQALAEVAPNYRAVFCDLWGCLHDGKVPFPAAVAALQAFRAQGGIVVLVTNAPRPKPNVVAQLNRMGVPQDVYDEVASSGDAAQFALFSGAAGQRIYFIGGEKDESFLTDCAPDLAATRDAAPPLVKVPLAEAEGIVCAGLFDDQTETPEDYRATLLLAKTNGLPLLCANPDIVVDFGHKRLYCAGAIAKAYDEMGGTSLYFGKPHPPIYDLARRRLAAINPDITDDQILCIGDGILTDVLGGVNEGLDTLFVTGGLAAAEFGPDVANPDADLLTGWLADQKLTPTAAIGFLR